MPGDYYLMRAENELRCELLKEHGITQGGSLGRGTLSAEASGGSLGLGHHDF